MANIMSIKSLRNKTSRNGFDLSTKRNFTAKAGELLPIWCKEVLPGDSFKINLKSFTRTQPINTAAFARMREYYDFFFVPYDLLWNKANTALTQINQSILDQLGYEDFSVETPDFPVNYTMFKVNPNCLDTLFAVNADSSINTDQFLCSTFFDVKAVRNLDTDGLPY